MPDNDDSSERQNPSAKPALSAEQREEAEQLLKRLAIYRRTLRHYLDQEAALGEAYTPPSILNGIYETREQIRQLKAILVEWSVPVEHYPDDEERPALLQRALIRKQTSRLPFLPIIIGAGSVAIVALLGLFLFSQQHSLLAQSFVPTLPAATAVPATAVPTVAPTPLPTIPPTPTPIPPVAPVAQGNYMVLVSQFALRRDSKEDTTQPVVQNLKNVFERYLPQSKLQVRFYPGVITSDEQAVEVADKNKAAVIVWGSTGPSSTGVDIQVGSLKPFPNSKISRDIIERSVNIHVEMTSTEQLSIAPHVLVVLQAMQTSDGEGTAIVRNADIIDQMINNVKLVSPLIDNDNVAAHVHRGLLLHFRDPSKAIEEYDPAVKQDSTNPLLYVLRAIALSRLGQFDRAAQDTATAARLEPTRTWTAPIYLQMLAGLFRSDYADALSATDAIVQQQPQDWFPLSARGVFHYFLGDYQNARVDLVRAIELGPESSLPYQTLALVDLHEGKIAEAQQQLATAQQKFRDPQIANRLLTGLFGDQPNIVSALFGSFDALSFVRPDDTIQYTQQGLQSHPDDADLLMLQGIAHCIQKQYPEAEASYSQAIDHAPSFTVLRLLRAESRLRQQNQAGVGEDVAFIQHDPNAAAFAPYLEAFSQGKFSCEKLLAP